MLLISCNIVKSLKTHFIIYIKNKIIWLLVIKKIQKFKFLVTAYMRSERDKFKFY